MARNSRTPWYAPRWYTPYHQDRDDIAYRKAHRTSNTTKLKWFIIWFALIIIFA